MPGPGRSSTAGGTRPAPASYGAGKPDMYQYVLDWMVARLKGYFAIPTLETFTVHSTMHDPIITTDHPEIQRAYQFGSTLPQL